MRHRPLPLFSIPSCSLYFLKASTVILDFIYPMLLALSRNHHQPLKCEQDVLIRPDPRYALHLWLLKQDYQCWTVLTSKKKEEMEK